MMSRLLMKEQSSLEAGKWSTKCRMVMLQAVTHDVMAKQSASKTSTIDLRYNVHLNREEKL